MTNFAADAAVFEAAVNAIFLLLVGVATYLANSIRDDIRTALKNIEDNAERLERHDRALFGDSQSNGMLDLVGQHDEELSRAEHERREHERRISITEARIRRLYDDSELRLVERRTDPQGDDYTGRDGDLGGIDDNE